MSERVEGFSEAVDTGLTNLNETGSKLNCKTMYDSIGRSAPMCGLDLSTFGQKLIVEDMHAKGDVNVQERLHFGDPRMTKQAKHSNNTDSYYLQKNIHGGDRSSLDLTINDNANESFRILGNSCREGQEGCHGPGVEKHSFRADGDAAHSGNLKVSKDVNVAGDLNADRNFNVQGRLHFGDPRMTKRGSDSNNSDSYYLQKNIHGEDQSSLDLTINDNVNESFRILGNSCREGQKGCHGPGVEKHSFRSDGDAWHRGRVKAEKFCIGDTCIGEDELASSNIKDEMKDLGMRVDANTSKDKEIMNRIDFELSKIRENIAKGTGKREETENRLDALQAKLKLVRSEMKSVSKQRGPKGEKGEKGESGPRGPRGRDGKGSEGGQGRFDTLCVGNTCIGENELKKLKGKRHVKLWSFDDERDGLVNWQSYHMYII